jgi:hypothetical protein
VAEDRTMPLWGSVACSSFRSFGIDSLVLVNLIGIEPFIRSL